ncbi:MAG: helix-turn-helix protein [Pseudomonadota bacterium]
MVIPKVMNEKGLAQLIFTRRLKLKRSQKEIAEYLGVSEETLERYERGLLPIPLVHIYGLSNCLNIEPSKLEDYVELPPIISEGNGEG